jgi:NADH-quinone oxidoreductase subunit D
MAVEELAGLEVTPRAQYIRVMVLELSRLAGQFLWMAGQSGSIGLYAVGQWAMADRDLILDLFEELTGGRVYHMYIYPGGVRRDLPEGFLEKVSTLLVYMEKRLKDYDDIFIHNASFKNRAIGVGVISKEEAIANAYVGQVLRGCGIKADVRKDAPYLVYNELEFEIPTQTAGDAYARALVRRDEMDQSIHILEQVIAKMPDGEVMIKMPTHRKFKLPKDDTWVKVESARGEFAYYMAGDGSDKIRRMQVRGPSLVHAYTLLENLLVGAELSDVSLIMNSLGICPPEIER